jgi:hypothetical protein
MAALAVVALGTENMLKIAAPRCGIWPLPELMHHGPIENLFDAATKTRAGFWSLLPNRSQKLNHGRPINRAHVQITEGCTGATKRLLPLCLMLWILERAKLVASMVVAGLSELSQRTDLEMMRTGG